MQFAIILFLFFFLQGTKVVIIIIFIIIVPKIQKNTAAWLRVYKFTKSDLLRWQSVLFLAGYLLSVAAFFFFSFLIIYCTEFYTKDLQAVFSSKKCPSRLSPGYLLGIASWPARSLHFFRYNIDVRK